MHDKLGGHGSNLLGAHLGELEFLEFQTSHDTITNDIGGSEKPATTAALLVGDRRCLEIENVVEDVLIRNTSRTRTKDRSDVSL